MRLLQGHQDAVYGVAYSPDGTMLATAGADTTVKLWDLGTGAELATFREGRLLGQSVAFSPDGQLLAAGGAGKLVLWDVATRKRLAVLMEERSAQMLAHLGDVRALAFSADGRTLASASADRTVKLWDVRGPAADRGGAAARPATACPTGKSCRRRRWPGSANPGRRPGPIPGPRRHAPAGCGA
jgi:WD40 repeat protein